MAGDPYYYQTQLLLHGDGTTLVDTSDFARTVTQGDASFPVEQTTSNAKTGFAECMYFDGQSSKSLVANSVPPPGTNDFTIEFFMSFSYGGHNYNANSVILSIGTSSTMGQMVIYLPGSGSFGQPQLWYYNGSGYALLVGTATSYGSSMWHHFAFTRAGDVYTAWVDGVAVSTGTTSGVNITSTGFRIGSSHTGSLTASFWMDEFRYTTGVARYTSTFTPPTAPFPDRPAGAWQVWLTDTTAFNYTGVAPGAQHTGALTESVALQDLYTLLYAFTRTETVAISEGFVTKNGATVVETLSLPDVVARGLAIRQSSADITFFGDASDVVRRPGAVATDAVRLAELFSSNLRAGTVLSDTALLREALRVGRVALASDTVGLADALALQRALRVTESLGLVDVWAPSLRFGITQAERVRIVDALVRFFGGDIFETVGLNDVLAKQARRPVSAAEVLGLADPAAATFVLRIETAESLNISELDAVHMLFAPQLQDGVQIAAAFLSAGDGITSWVVNAITGAVTEYDNYAFNSFAHFGQMYIAADSEGLYELNGVTDDGDAIIARIQSGLAQLTESRFTMLRDAYIGMRSDGKFVLRIVTGDGQSYSYRFTAESMKTVRVQLGKGMRTRYASFELIGEGDDFDLDSVEFIPLTSQRRV
jgi:hypothetical protein